ncbi:TIGR03960 family B12-binding radical SAM protein [candidate division WOR-3 bacterium]|uniref:TIGR03960 family B12-binding radical SAM protein n=1 Tax=candidate division WOR-3 bacterium TaxID=2052148 RepID=A0A9D5QD42_UNCW3|nr:TIGR03960 family B12-binding radical SAM protein [candidate division WOR-3 bacterium]MBD3364661.1 TIGR03960 family B12-binding radical SAM protein [candidate division WOR-3 bacterium]
MKYRWQARFESLLPQVERPIRYTDSELFTVHPSDSKVRVALVFPDTYEIGMSNYGLRVLYHIVNRIPGAAAERAFMPWMDMLERMEAEGIPLHSLETRTPLCEFDMVGISLESEMGYTNALGVLKLSGVPIRSQDRSEEHPVIVAGGPCTANPLPLAPFFDGFLVGDGEDAIGDMVDTLLCSKTRKERIAGLAEIEGMWVPEVHRKNKIVKRRVVSELRSEDAPVRQIVPTAGVEHDRYVVEISRGCLRGCRFCQAGFANRPMRIRSVDDILNLSEQGVRQTGWEEVSLLSFAVSDYPGLQGLLSRLSERLSPANTSISLPSFRGEAFTLEMGTLLRRVKKTGLTFAPETASPRLKRSINKNVSNQDILERVAAAARLGWRRVKLYFMIGLPGEIPEDIDMNIEFVRELARKVKGMMINVHVSPFVPKPHTPFQWVAFEDINSLEEKLARMREEVKVRRVKVKWADPAASLIEAVLARGDEHISDVLERVLFSGGYFQEWSEHFILKRWLEAFSETGLSLSAYTEAKEPEDRLPWDFIDTGVSGNFLRAEYRNASVSRIQPDCLTGSCYGCGIGCNDTPWQEGTSGEVIPGGKPGTRVRVSQSSKPLLRYRIKLAVGEELRYASHLDLVRAVYRMLRRSGLPIAYTEGYSPHPKVSFGFPKPVGITSRAEYVDINLNSRASGVLLKDLSAAAPPGLKALASRALLPHAPAITKVADMLHYQVSEGPETDTGLLKKRASLLDNIHHLHLLNSHLGIILADARRVKLWDVLSRLYNITPSDARRLAVERIDAYINRGRRLITPLEEA